MDELKLFAIGVLAGVITTLATGVLAVLAMLEPIL